MILRAFQITTEISNLV